MCRSIRKTARRRGPWPQLFLLLAWLALYPLHALAGELPPGPVSETLLLAVRINGVDQGDVFQLHHMPGGRLGVSEADLRAWHLRVPDQDASGNRAYVPLDDVPGLVYRLESRSQTLLIEAPANAFEASVVAAEARRSAGPLPSQPGGFFNYDLQWQDYAGSTAGMGLFEAGFFNRYGSGTTTGLWNSASPNRQWVRLESTWTMDDPDTMRSLRLGDTVSRAGAWGRAVRFGGIQWTTNFATQPNFIAFPLPNLRGEAVLPSTVDVYLNNARVLRGDVQAGPFDVPEVPVVTGQGEVQMVVKDMLGRQQVITRPYYVSPRLLRPGLRDFSYELGAIREDYGIASAHYGRAMLAATDRLGVTPEFTRELRAELLTDQQTVGAAGVWLLPSVGTVQLAAAASHGEDGSGRLVSVGAERQTSGFSASVQVQYADRAFVQVGSVPGVSPRRSMSASIGMPVAKGGLGLAYVSQLTWQGAENRLVSASYSLSLDRLGYLGFYALRNLSVDQPDTSVGVTLIHVLDPVTSVSLDSMSIGGRSQHNLQLQRSLPAGNGFGYRLLAGQGDSGRYDASLTWRTDRGDVTAQSGRFMDSSYQRVGLSGGIAVLGGNAFVGHRIDESFAVIKVGDFAGIRVYRDNQEIGRTDESGLILATRLLPYQRNQISVEQADLPMDAWVDKLQLKLTPALRTGVYAEVPVRRVRNAVFRLIGEDGAVLTPGTLVRIDGQDANFPVGYEGRTFVSGISERNRLLSSWQGRPCMAELLAGTAGEPVQDLGTLVCKGISE